MFMNPFSVFYYSIRSNYRLAIFVWLTRFLLAFAFIPSGMKKLLGQRFTNIGIEHPIGFFFEALYRSGMYWNFIGWGQIFAALLLMTQRFSTLGNIIYFFIISNICFITLSMHFTGTWVITSLMLFASTCLLLWDANKLQYIFSNKEFLNNRNDVNLPEASSSWQKSGFLLFTWSLAYVIIDQHISSSHLLCFLVFFVLIISTVLVTLLVEWKNSKLK
jgi:uncharacterized membrane protein YphA (DoxX/SURF4 family)